ncbi:class F sortase [Bacillus cereus]|uniref:class F sortase n=1 Tax=Bacillus cereus TaxID=1396 RepID=UPI00095357A3|nr:class F sortase [Bacillus cereus]OLR24672.1 hypothetical protein BLD50_16280 [Bacillus cereus]
MQQRHLFDTADATFQKTSLIKPIVPNSQNVKEKELSMNISSLPVKLTFQRTQVTVNILPVGLDKDGRMIVKDGLETASWYQQSAIPGNQGNALIAGHRDWKGVLGGFQYLETIQKNEKVLIQYEDKEIRTFQVVEKNVYPMNEVPEEAMNIQGESRVTLITCTGKFIREKGGYQSRIIVILQLV